ncbi:MAG: 30S ribosomal protein S2 [Candidatus Gastranaerophilales bacterium]|nr:30S ribosomal protein S2 [Candidatus Gastranaerophilales bacterium]
MPTASMIELLEAGVHFGHQTQRWNPKMKPYIYGARNGIYVLDLRKTTDLLDEAYAVVRKFSARNKNILFVGTKRQAAEVVAQEAQRAGIYYINRRWLGGLLTNFETIRARVNKLRELEEFISSGHIEKLPKKEVAQLQRQLNKLSKTLGGIKEMRGLPDLIFVVDQQKELIAIQEANKLKIPVICLADTNANPDNIDYLIPGNDDAIRSIKLISSRLADAVLEGKQLRENNATVSTAKAPKIKKMDDTKETVATEEPVDAVEAKEQVAEAVVVKTKEETTED